MAAYYGRLTPKMLEKAKREGKDNLREAGRGIGGQRFYGDHDEYFESDNVDMKRIKEFAEDGLLQYYPATPKSRPADTETAIEINEEINEVTKQRGRPKVK